MADPLDYGPVLSDAEYERRMVELYQATSDLPTRQEDLEIRRRELDLIIDHRLGCRFPQERREALWNAQRIVEARRLRLAFSTLTRAVMPKRFKLGAGRLARFAVDEYSKVLSSDELERFLGDESSNAD